MEESPHHNRVLGVEGEGLAVAFLERLGYRIVERNFRFRGGEVDIIARDRQMLVFVEVKTRRTAKYGPPQLAVTPFKQRQLSKAALAWLAKNRSLDKAARFDVIAITFDHAGSSRVEHFVNAFELAY